MPIEIEPLLSDPDMSVWFDDQKWWYILLLLRAWGNVENPCHLPNEPSRLRTLAGVPPCRQKQWAERSGAVIAKFGVSSDGRWIANRKQLEVYANQLAKLDARRDAGSKGGKARAENLAKCSNATSLLPVCSSSTSLSLSDSAFDSKKEKPDIDSEEFVTRVMGIGFRDSTRRSRSLIEHALFEEVSSGADPPQVVRALENIYRLTENGMYAPKCYEVIPRWRELPELWERRNGKSQPNGAETSRAEVRAERSDKAIEGAFARFHKPTGAPDEGGA